MPVASMIPVQQGIFTKLVNDVTLSTLVTGVFDHVPQSQPYPYVVLGETFQTSSNTHGRFGSQHLVTLDIWSQYAGDKEVKQIMGRLFELLDNQPLNVLGFSHVYSKMELMETLRDPDGETRHGVFRVRVEVQE